MNPDPEQFSKLLALQFCLSMAVKIALHSSRSQWLKARRASISAWLSCKTSPLHCAICDEDRHFAPVLWEVVRQLFNVYREILSPTYERKR